MAASLIGQETTQRPLRRPRTDDVAAPSSPHPQFQPRLGVAIKPRSPERDHPGQAALACRGTWLWSSGFRQCTAGGIGTKEQIPERPTQPIRDPSAGQMVRTIMDHVAALTQAFQVALPVVARIMIEMRRRQDDAGLPERHRLLDIRPSRWPAPAAAPGVAHRVEPTAIGQAADGLSVRPAAPLADTTGALETHASADLRPVDRVEPAQFTIDRQWSPRVRDGEYIYSASVGRR